MKQAPQIVSGLSWGALPSTKEEQTGTFFSRDLMKQCRETEVRSLGWVSTKPPDCENKGWRDFCQESLGQAHLCWGQRGPF